MRAGDGDVVGVFVIEPRLVRGAGPTRQAYLRRSLAALDQSLDGRLVVRDGDPALVLAHLARSVGAREVFATGDTTPWSRARDERVGAALASAGLRLRVLDSPYAVAPGTLATASGSPYRVFGPFERAWRPLASVASPRPASAPDWRRVVSEAPTWPSGPYAGRPWYFGDLPDEPPPASAPAGESAALARLASLGATIQEYATARDQVGVEGTTRLSAALHFGELHPRQVLAVLRGSGPGPAALSRQLAWRDFYADVLWHWPSSRWRALQPAMERLRVDRDEAAAERFRLWARGRTGYPLIDAAMRQLLAEGWMHNRARMVAASFLVKHLHLDWRWGARWFLWRLVDADVASNQHGWQWCAGVGTDAAPFFRVFNPIRQAQRVDPDGAYVRRYVAELAGSPAADCRRPEGGAAHYAPAMVDLARERVEALARYQEVRRGAPVGQ